MNDDLKELDRIARQHIEGEATRRRSLRSLLDWQGDRENHKIALPARMGTSKSYLISVSLGWIASNVYFARDLPVFKKHRRKGRKKISINDTTIANLQQREPDYRRQLPMALYLATREHHKFPPLFLVAYQNWAYDPRSDEWGPDGRAIHPSLNVKPLDSRSSLVDLDIATTHYFALDGQHRLMAIKGLKELLDDGRLNAKNKDGSPMSRKSISRDDVENRNSVSKAISGHGMDFLQDAMDEVMGVEILPAVQLNDTYEEAVSRLRNIFVDVNENAKRLEKGELTLLDENDGFRIVARTLMVKHPIFKKDKELRVDTQRDQLPETSESYTTLTTIVRIATEFVGGDFERWKTPILGLKGVGMERPVDDEIEMALKSLAKYFTALGTMPSHRKMMSGTPVSTLRKKSGEDNILFRPIAQIALSHALAEIKSSKGTALHSLIAKLAKHEELGHLKLTNKKAPWFGILCDPLTEKIRRHKRYESICSQMFIHLLGNGLADPEEREELRKNFFEARQVSTGSAVEKAYDMSGKLVRYSKFSLPRPWR